MDGDCNLDRLWRCGVVGWCSRNNIVCVRTASGDDRCSADKEADYQQSGADLSEPLTDSEQSEEAQSNSEVNDPALKRIGVMGVCSIAVLDQHVDVSSCL